MLKSISAQSKTNVMPTAAMATGATCVTTFCMLRVVRKTSV